MGRYLTLIGALEWIRVPPMRLSGYPETRARADAARLSTRWRPTNTLLASLQRLVFAASCNGSRAWFLKNPHVVAVAWNGLKGIRRVFMDGARDAGARTLYFELSPFKARLTCDPKGVNHANALPRNVEFYRGWLENAGLDSDAWRAYRLSITQRAALRQNPDLPPNAPLGPYLFAALQVPGDSQLVVFGGAFRTVPAFIEALVAAAEALPDGWHLRVKEHPSAKIQYAHLIAGRSRRVVLDNSTDTFALVANSAGVVTVNSSVGIEAMFFDRPVVACGECFWALSGIALAARTPADLSNIFGDPVAQTFEPAARAAFLSYLLTDYYIRLDADPLAESAKIAQRLDPSGWP